MSDQTPTARAGDLVEHLARFVHDRLQWTIPGQGTGAFDLLTADQQAGWRELFTDALAAAPDTTGPTPQAAAGTLPAELTQALHTVMADAMRQHVWPHVDVDKLTTHALAAATPVLEEYQARHEQLVAVGVMRHEPAQPADRFDTRQHPCGCVTHFDLAFWRSRFESTCPLHAQADPDKVSSGV